ncbi:Proactivator polypeptide [Tetrabaena socialis]|uniref:Proactivator polypeptide n=1 Tax=Tetrabaena socialis TaxID=47790 RepID=A0A2J7ZME5_9CHLO|nr:Proactivator polypeptide [Tetrabaena socialis]|eukprot:PNH01420.1 Proactivator polypeptide [Tetrabaena socialis]
MTHRVAGAGSGRKAGKNAKDVAMDLSCGVLEVRDTAGTGRIVSMEHGTRQGNQCGSLLRMAVGAASDRDSSQACELLGMCVAGLTRFRLPPLGPGLVAALAAAREDVGPAAGRLAAATQQPALRDNRCDACKMMVLEVHTLISNPDFQTSLTTYAEAACDTTAPPAYAAFCKSTVDAYVPLVMGALQQYVQPDPVCQRLHLCAAPSVWQELLGALRVGSFGMLGRVQG